MLQLKSERTVQIYGTILRNIHHRRQISTGKLFVQPIIHSFKSTNYDMLQSSMRKVEDTRKWHTGYFVGTVLTSLTK